jgi:hypothetical protein
MKNFVVIGSCLSGSVAKHLVELGYSLLLAVDHLRIDAFNAFLKDASALGAPKGYLDTLVGKMAAGDDKSEKRFRRRAISQSTEKLVELVDAIKSADLIVFDNNYDLSSKLVQIEGDLGQKYTFSNFNRVENEWFNLGLFDISSAGEVYEKFYNSLLALNPALKPIFIQYPVSGFIHNPMQQQRVQRARNTSSQLGNYKGAVFPLIEMPKHCLSEKGEHYFVEHVYKIYADSIDRLIMGELLPFDPACEINFSKLEAFAAGTSISVTEAETALSKLRPQDINPYKNLPDRQFWKKAVAERYPLAIDQLYDGKFEITRQHRVATCGSCFAQHIGRRMRTRGFNYLDVENAPQTLPVSQHIANGYGIYSARYGNVYTSRQLLQLARRALGEFVLDEVWALPANDKEEIRYVDPFRPNLHPGGFETPEQVLEEQRSHLAKVRELLTSMEVFIFTMGLTECWYNKQTGAAYPIAPGVTAGEFDPAIHAFKNLSYEEIMADMREFIELVKSINPACKMLLTVSPVPLTATAENTHVLVATMRSKSILRAVTSSLYEQYDFVDYFPSYEIIMSHPFRGMFFQNNLRTIHEQGVDFVMSHFFAVHGAEDDESGLTCDEGNEDFCDEVFLDLENRVTQSNS